MSDERLISKALEVGGGIFRLAPTWVPRSFLPPGGRLKLAPQDIYALGVNRGVIVERWFSSTTRADNPGAPEDEGLSYIIVEESPHIERILLKEAIEIMGDIILGKDVMNKYGGLKAFAKFYDYSQALFFHLHPREEHTRRVNRQPKPEAYYFPPQLNFFKGDFPYTFFGLEPSTTKDDIKECLKRWNKGDNDILIRSRAYKLQLGTGWLIPSGVLHAPGSLLTYEPQGASDVGAVYQSLLGSKRLPWDLLVKDVPREYHKDLDYLVDMIDWEANLDPEFKKYHFLKPKLVAPEETRREGYEEKWITYGSPDFSAKELTIFPEKSVKIQDAAAYGLVVVQGHGSIGNFIIESPTMIRFGQPTDDELFVTIEMAKGGVVFKNNSRKENLVILRHFGPGNPDSESIY